MKVARLSGVSLRQLQWWDEKKVVSPRHEGHRRVYSPAEVIEIKVIAELRRKGFSLQGGTRHRHHEGGPPAEEQFRPAAASAGVVSVRVFFVLNMSGVFRFERV